MKNIQWIKSPVDKDGAAFIFAKTFNTVKEVENAVVSISSVGVYKAVLGGQKIGNQILTPGYTSYDKRIQFNTYDITDKIKNENNLEITVAPGWAVGHLGYKKDCRNFYSDHVIAVAEIEITYTDGTCELINTDGTWSVYTSPVVYSDIYMGETFDATYEPEFLGTAVLDNFNTTLIPQEGEDIVEHERLAPVELIITPKGERVIDFGQNMTGYVEFNVKGKKGEKIVTTCAEVLDKDGNFYNANYRNAKNKITFILDGTQRRYKPEFSIQGFRYIRLEEYPDMPINLDDIRAIVVHSDIERTGYFECGYEKINQLYHNIIWGQKSNYLDVPTDCPQRDERLGWTGDTQVFCRTAALNFNVSKFFEKWLGDLRVDQREDGAILGVCPEWHTYEKGALYQTRISAAWGDAAVIVPWEIYRAYGDKNFLEKNFEMMKKWADFIHGSGPEEFLWIRAENEYHYGDWLGIDIDGGSDSCEGATSKNLISSVYFANAVDIVVKAGEELGKDVSEYRELYKKIFARFHEYFVEKIIKLICDPEHECEEEFRGKVHPNVTQTSLSLILYFKLYLPEEKEIIANKLEELIHAYGDRMTTGFVGTPYILHALTKSGKSDVAYTLLFQNKNPSWLYSVEKGATTMWEHWNGIKEDGSFWSDSMNSFNHYAYGAVGDWLYGTVAGISVCENGAGYKKIVLQPHPDKRLGFVNCTVDTVRGKVQSNWYYKCDKVYFEFTVPQGTEAKIVLPNGYTETVRGGKYMYIV